MSAKKQNPLLVKKHWHLMVYTVPCQGLPQSLSLYANSKQRLMTLPEISAARESRGIPDGAVLIGLDYMGFGSQCDFTGQHPDPVPSAVTDAWLQGMEMALSAGDPTQLVNPYDNVEHDVHYAQEWQLGFSTGLRMRSSNPATVL